MSIKKVRLVCVCICVCAGRRYEIGRCRGHIPMGVRPVWSQFALATSMVVGLGDCVGGSATRRRGAASSFDCCRGLRAAAKRFNCSRGLRAAGGWCVCGCFFFLSGVYMWNGSEYPWNGNNSLEDNLFSLRSLALKVTDVNIPGAEQQQSGQIGQCSRVPRQDLVPG